MKTTLYVIRHGESVANHMDALAGQMNVPLTPLGVRQARKTAEFLQDVPLTAIYSSDLCRAAETARLVAEKHHLSYTQLPELREINGGLWEGMSYKQIIADYPAEYRVWKENIGLAACPGGETTQEVQARAKAAIDGIVSRHPEEAVCLVAHGLMIRMMEGVWTDTPAERIRLIPFVANASVTVVEYRNGTGRILQRDLHEHLAELVTFMGVDV